MIPSVLYSRCYASFEFAARRRTAHQAAVEFHAAMRGWVTKKKKVVATVLVLAIANCKLNLLKQFVGATVCRLICGSNGLWVQRFVGAICGSNRNLSKCNFDNS